MTEPIEILAFTLGIVAILGMVVAMFIIKALMDVVVKLSDDYSKRITKIAHPGVVIDEEIPDDPQDGLEKYVELDGLSDAEFEKHVVLVDRGREEI